MKKLLFVILLVLSACVEQPVKNDPTVHKTQLELIPLTVGNTWTYVDKSTGKQVKSLVEKSQIIDGVEWFKYNEVGDSFWVRNRGLEQFEAIDFFNEDKIQSSIENEALVLTTLTTEYMTPGVIKATSKPCSIPLKVPAGEFNCHIIQFEFGNNQFSKNYYAKGVGLIKNEFKADNKYTEIELINYQLK
ncbi:hypothetical protein A9Q78_04910 [Methylophaga sp. 41_12_T18]|nr:hypothetical protein A9Q78_04910 [Methylophaga sp. 41_12_T18]